MKKRKYGTQWMVGTAMMAAIVILLANTPLGMIQLPIIKITTVHIPVIIDAILFGPLSGSILGGIFGICSMMSNTMAPTLLSFCFSPFLSTTGLAGALKAVWISVGCRIFIGLIAGWLWILFKKLKMNDFAALPITGIIGSMVNTIFVLGSIYLLFAPQYADVQQVAVSAVFGLIMLTVGTSGVPEAIASVLLVTAIGKALLKVMRRVRKPAKSTGTAKSGSRRKTESLSYPAIQKENLSALQEASCSASDGEGTIEEFPLQR